MPFGDFYPRSPCGERQIVTGSGNSLGNFYPRSPCGERRSENPETHQPYAISIHALLAESDRRCKTMITAHAKFLSTLSLRRATVDTSKDIIKTANFYPRSPCGERLLRKPTAARNDKFLSTLSLRRATKLLTKRLCNALFLSTLSLRRATQRHLPDNTRRRISIHALLAESDWTR